MTKPSPQPVPQPQRVSPPRSLPPSHRHAPPRQTQPANRLLVVLSSLAVLGFTPAALARPGHKKKEKERTEKSERKAVRASGPASGLVQAAVTTPVPSPPPPVAAPAIPPAPAGTLLAANTATPAPASTLTPVAQPAPSANPVPPAPASAPATESATPTPDAVAPSPSPVPPGSVFYVEHLGAEAYPGDKRGLYGGSLWLEPSFHGLQWPYMPRSGVGISGYVWVDTGYERITRGQGAFVFANTKEEVQQARAVLRATPTYSDGAFFVQGQVEVVGNGDQIHSQNDVGAGIVDVDDLWIRVGTWNVWDLKVGRYEAWEMYHTGMGLDINTIERRGATQSSFGSNFDRPDYYGVTFLHDRPALQNVGNVALHLYPTSYLRFELLGQLGADGVQTNGGSNYIGGRPAAILDLGWLKLKAAGEWEKRTLSDTLVVPGTDANGNPIQTNADSKFSQVEKGIGGSMQFVFSKWEAGVSGGVGWRNSNPNNEGSQDPVGTDRTASVGVFANVSGDLVMPRLKDLLVGGGFNWTTRTDANKDTQGRVDYTANLQTFGAVQYLVAHQLFVKGVVAYARSDFDLSALNGGNGGLWSDYMLSLRVRLMYLF